MRRVATRLIPALALLPLLAGCAVSGVAQRQAELAQYVGVSEADLVRGLGVPSRSFESGGRKFLAYTESRVDLLPGSYAGIGYGYGRFGYGYGGGFPAEAIERVCETTFELDAGKVTSFTLRGNAC